MNETNTTVVASAECKDVSRLRDLSPLQWKSGIAAWLGWLFDGLDMHLYGLVAAPFVALLLGLSATDTANALVREKSSWIQAAFLVGWALQFIGHAFEGKQPEFFHDWRFLFVGVRWWWAKMRGRA